MQSVKQQCQKKKKNKLYYPDLHIYLCCALNLVGIAVVDLSACLVIKTNV